MIFQRVTDRIKILKIFNNANHVRWKETGLASLKEKAENALLQEVAKMWYFCINQQFVSDKCV